MLQFQRPLVTDKEIIVKCHSLMYMYASHRKEQQFFIQMHCSIHTQGDDIKVPTSKPDNATDCNA